MCFMVVIRTGAHRLSRHSKILQSAFLPAVLLTLCLSLCRGQSETSSRPSGWQRLRGMCVRKNRPELLREDLFVR